MRLAADWLAARQQPDGSWGSAYGNTLLTSVAWLALKGMGDAVDAIARDRAVVWLDREPVEADAAWEVYAWRILMIAHALPADSPERKSRIEAIIPHRWRLARILSKEDMPKRNDVWLWHEAIVQSGVWLGMIQSGPHAFPDSEALEEIEAFASNYPPEARDPESLWSFARLVNRHRGGLLLRETEALDWRNDFARVLISTLRKDPKGGGYWDGTTDDAKIRATAFALLALREIH
ncbi:MAG: hypothetical protein FWH21_09380 [Kiritimatiellaeota bacterium]|nr:hypothetical protein [Kiritimatiellota bacterium]